jgi:hypothetical protein
MNQEAWDELEQRNCKFRMEWALFPAALDALQTLVSNKDTDLGWVDSLAVLGSDTFPEALSACGWELDLDEGLSAVAIRFSGQKYAGDEVGVLEAIAPFVADDSWIEMSGEQGEIWRWVFKNGGVTEEDADITCP